MFYIVYDLDFYPRNPINNFKFKNCLFWASKYSKKKKKMIKKSMCKVAMEGHLIVQVHGVLLMTLLQDNDNVIIFGVILTIADIIFEY